jgi:hypothetical protein
MSNSATAPVRTLVWDTNYNNKIGCTGMVHIDLAPRIFPVKSEAERMVFEIKTADNSHPPITYTFYDMITFPLKDVPCLFSLASHGMTEMEFCDYMFSKYKTITWNERIAVYFYRRIIL